MQRIVLAYSGGLEGTVAIPWLAEKHRAEVVTLTLDFGSAQDLEEVRERALAAGAVRAHVLDVRDEFARGYVLPALKADAAREGGFAIGGALAGALIAAKLIEIASLEQAQAIAHGCTTGSHRQWLNAPARALNPSLAILAPGPGRRVGFQDTGLAPADAAVPGRVPVAGPVGASLDEAASVELTFERGVPVAINAVAMPLVELMASLGTIASAHGVGSGRSGGIFEGPAAVVLQAAHRELQCLMTPDAERFSRLASAQYADLVRHGLWFSPLREALDAYVEKLQERVTGVIVAKLFKGVCDVIERKPLPAPDSPRRQTPAVRVTQVLS
jgi:argininosuccinate synthase